MLGKYGNVNAEATNVSQKGAKADEKALFAKFIVANEHICIYPVNFYVGDCN